LRKIAEGIGEREWKMMTEENTIEININRNTGNEEMSKMSLYKKRRKFCRGL
jgi:hypothetical protein